MSDFFIYLFFTIGFIATFFGIATAIIWAVERSSELKRERDERYRDLIQKLDEIAARMRCNKDGL